MCDVLRALELSTMRLKRYIDQLLAVLLEQKPSLLEGLPRIQQERGLDLDLFTVASLTEVLNRGYSLCLSEVMNRGLLALLIRGNEQGVTRSAYQR